MKTVAALIPIAATVALLSSTAVSSAAPSAPATAEPEPVLYLVVYRPGSAWPAGAPLSKLDLKAHGRYMIDLYARGVLERAGGFTNDSGGAMLLRVPDESAARAVVAGDPAVTSSLFVAEIFPWRQVDWQRRLDKRNKAAAGSQSPVTARRTPVPWRGDSSQGLSPFSPR